MIDAGTLLRAAGVAMFSIALVQAVQPSADLLGPLHELRNHELDSALRGLASLCPGSRKEISRAADRGDVACKILVFATVEKESRPDPKGFALVYWKLGDDLKQREPDLARALFEVSIERDQKDAGAWHSLAMLEHDRGRYQEALEAFQRSVELDPTEPNTLYWLGTTQMELGKLDEAEGTFARVLRIDPKHARVWFRRGEMEMTRGNYAAAIKHFEKAHAEGVPKSETKPKIKECETHLSQPDSGR